MQEKRNSQEMRALQILLSIDESPQRPKNRQNITEPISQSGVKRYVRSGKENQPRRDILPPLANSKEELKLILRKLEESDTHVKAQKRVKVVRKSDHGSHTVAVKTNRQRGLSDSPPKKEGNRSILQINKGDDIRTLMRQNNYSTNALNLKTLNILQQINAKNYRAGGPKSTQGENRGTKRNVLAFLRRVA